MAHEGAGVRVRVTSWDGPDPDFEGRARPGPGWSDRGRAEGPSVIVMGSE